MGDLELAISTYGKRALNILHLDLPVRSPTSIFWQQPIVDLEYEEGVAKFGDLIKLESIGVANSRNAAIQCCEGRYIWFLDDDISIGEQDITMVKDIIANESPDVILVSVDNGISRKVVSKSVRKRDILSIGTVQIIINREKVNKAQILFPKNMGAGAEYPVCDEPIFLARLWRAKMKFVGAPNVVVKHSGISSGSVITGWRSVASRGMLFRELYGFPLCFLAGLIFLFKWRRRVGRFWWAVFWCQRPD